ncbi:MAG: hypothetical protein Q4D26_03575 [Clostridia bacterium]|nr:hypothetical protein [Clostridia bacterium]
MEVIFKIKNFTDDCNSIIDLLYEEENGRIQKYIADFFDLDISFLYKAGKEEGRKIILCKLKNEYLNMEQTINNKLCNITRKWNEVSKDIFNILENIFKYRLDQNRKIIGEFTINAVCPRYLDSWKFDINFRKNDEEIILACIHEIIHFIWFEKWSDVFPYYGKYEYNAPYLPWLFSEIAVDALLKETDLYKYCITDKPAYKHFYNIYINDKNMMEYFRELFRQGSIEDFMINGIKFIQENKNIIQS